ncbi:MAG: hypothetical protein K2X62_11055 [Beijerinckiaceae bacterium]|jgi:hypothetical protein|nr:hypothetical protein [Beijerinckiaceae bacterium]MDO9439714.1 hypothetical protein [Beijerinckiaceae bacterium]
MSEYEVKHPVPPQIQDARDLQAHLYREIGIAAVMAALQHRDRPAEPRRRLKVDDIPAILRGEDIAA